MTLIKSRFENTYGEAQPTYYVWGEGTAMPTKSHPSRYKAEKEAERLCGLHPDRTFHVLKLKRSLRLADEAAQPASSIPKERSGGQLAEDLKQLVARVGLPIGSSVRVNESHTTAGGLHGVITRHGVLDDTSTYVKLHGNFDEARFAPTSLILNDEAAKRKPQQKFGGIFTDIVLGLIADTLSAREPALHATDETGATSPQPAEDNPDVLRHITRVRNMRTGSPVHFLVMAPMGPIPGGAVPATFIAPCSNPQTVYIDMQQGDRLVREEVHASRVFATDDEALVILNLD